MRVQKYNIFQYVEKFFAKFFNVVAPLQFAATRNMNKFQHILRSSTFHDRRE